MRRGLVFVTAWMWVACGVSTGFGQSAGPGAGPDSSKPAHVCECGKHPPGPPRDREVVPYAGEPPLPSCAS